MAKTQMMRLRHSKTGLLLICALAGAAILYFGVVVPLFLRFNRSSIPAFPDSAGHPPAMVAYLKATYSQAMDHPTSDEAVGKLGMAFHAHDFYDEAAACYRRAEELNPNEWRWTYYVSLLDEGLGNTKAVIKGLTTVIEKQPDYPMAWFRLGNSYLKARSFQDAHHAFRQVLQLPEQTSPMIAGVLVPVNGAFPLKAYATLQLARILFLQKRLADARSLLAELIDANARFGPALRLMGDVYYEMGNEEEAADWRNRADHLDSYVPPADVLYEALVLCSRNTDFITRRINTAMRWGNYEWTVTLLDHILDYDPRNGPALTLKINVVLDTHRIDELGPLVVRYGEQFKSDEQALLEMARHLRRWGQYDATVTLLTKIITRNPRNVDAHVEYVRLMTMFRQYDNGIQYCTNLLATDPQNAPIRVELIDLLIQNGELARAEEELTAEQRLYPDVETRSMMLGRIARKKGDAVNAVRHFQRALAATPRKIPIQLELGKYLVELRRWNDAEKHWQKALQASPGNIDFTGLYALLLAACPDASIRNGKKALEMSARIMPLKKQTFEQDIRCATAIAAAYAEMGQYDNALSVAREYLQLSDYYGKTDYVGQMQAFVKLFESRKPYRL
jgi:tetratricopeptide (TPR) repeat protein